MKNILLIIGLLIGLVSFGQTPAYYQQYPTRANFLSGKFDSSLHIPRGCGKPTAYTAMNTKNWKYGFALYGDTCNKKLYQYVDSTWTLIGDSAYNDIRYLANTISCGLTCSACGIVTYTGTGMNYYVSPAYYNIDFVPYYFAGDSVTLADGDATFDRFDAIVLTATGVDTIQGVPSSDPQLPQFDPCANILLTYVLVTAGTTTPAQVSDEVIYDENVETWTHTTGGTITANFAGTAQVFHGTKSITISSWSNNSYINFLGPSSYINSNYTTLSFWVRLTAIMVNNQNVSVQFFNNTTAVSNQVVGQITKGNITTYQSVGFNMSQFTFTSPVFNTVRIQFSGNQSNTFYLDWIRLQAGITQPPSTGITTRDRFGYPNEDVTMGENRSVNFRGTRTMNFDSVNAFGVYRNGINRMYVNSLSSGIFSPNGLNSAQTSDVVSQLNANNRTFVYAYNDSIAILNPDGSYSIYALPHIVDTSANKVMTWDASTKKISWGNWFGGGGTNIYNSNGTLTNFRTLTGGDSSLTFTFNNRDSSGFIISSNSTTAVNNRQRLIDVSLSGANSVSTQTTYGIYSANNHTGTSSTNIALYGIAGSGTTNKGVQGDASGSGSMGVYGNDNNSAGYGIYGNNSAGGYGVYGASTTNGYGIFGYATGSTVRGVYGLADITSGTGYAIVGDAAGGTTAIGGYFNSQGATNIIPLEIHGSWSSTNTIEVLQRAYRDVLFGNGAAGIGGAFNFYNENDAGTAVLENQIISKSTNAGASNVTSQLNFTGVIKGTVDTLYKMGDYVDLTESTATLFAQTTVGTGKIAGGEVNVTIEANDATDFQSRTMRFIWTAVNKAGTTTITIGTPEEVVASSSGATLTATITAVDGGSGLVQFKANAVSSLTQTTLRCSYQMSKNF